MKKWLSQKNNLAAVLVFLLIAVVIVVLVVIVKVSAYISTSRFYSAQALYEEYLHSIEGYVPENSPIDHIVVKTDFSEYGNIYRNHTTIWVYVTEDMRSYRDKAVLLNLYPYNQKIKELVSTMREKSGFESWSIKYLVNSRFKINGTSRLLDEKTTITYMVLGDTLLKYEIGDASFTKYMPESKRVEYSYKIKNNQLISFLQTYPAYNSYGTTGSSAKPQMPYVGMSEIDIQNTALGRATDVRKCTDFDIKDDRHKWKEYTWDFGGGKKVVAKLFYDTGTGVVYSVDKYPKDPYGNSIDWSSPSLNTNSKPSTSSSMTTKKYDPYNVYDYNSAQDFADDKYEEFYDYEDDYEDEDEAYDAAEDYWRAHHR